MPRLKIDITERSVPKATLRQYAALELKVCEKSGTLSAFCVNRDTTGCGVLSRIKLDRAHSYLWRGQTQLIITKMYACAIQ